jgi:hypothetical protein
MDAISGFNENISTAKIIVKMTISTNKEIK